MSKGYRPPDYGRGKTGNLRERVLEPDKQRKAQQARKDRAVEMHIKNSPTKKLLDWFFAIAMLSIIIQFVCQTAGFGARLGPLNYIPQMFLAPLKLVWHYGDKVPTYSVAGMAFPLPHLAMLLVYGVSYPILTAIHAVVSESRTYVPE
ncbi:MAG: hypothetical protein HZB16_05350 [Armatimonadetes bacterium]|nr:hypothetical protein [Armatimonadota bacterium]